ncbi:MAG: hypothetical protein ACJ8HI_23210 [Massilia sp.]|jgi:hypothetical protein
MAKKDEAPASDPAVNVNQEPTSADPNVAPPASGPFQGEQPKGDPAPAGGVEVELISDYWPAEQPAPPTDPRARVEENRVRAGERVTLPQEEVMNLLERGVAKRVQK